MNLLVGLLIPIALKIRWLPNVYDALFKGIYKYYDVRIDSLGEFLRYVYGNSYPIAYVLSIAMLLLPFQLIKDHYSLRMKVRISFLRKWIILSAIVAGWIALWGTVSNIWMIPIFHNVIYLAFAIAFGFIFTSLLYLTVDQYVERDKKV